MPSTFTTEPIGPRSVDEMLDVVYGRAAVLHRRRTTQRVGGAVAAVVLVLFGALTLQGRDEGALVRVVDERTGEAEKDEATAPDHGGDGNDAMSGPAAPAAPGAASRPPSSTPRKGATPARGAKATTTVPSLPAAPAPPVETWKSVTDSLNDATPPNWYYDIGAAAMEYHPSQASVVFTTRYRAPEGSTSGRQERELLSQFNYDGKSYAVRVVESGDRLGTPRVNDRPPCSACTAHFDAAEARLVVTVPLSTINEEIARQGNSPPLGAGAGARIGDLLAVTSTMSAGEPTLDADTTAQAR